MHYNKLERAIAKTLDRFPNLKSKIKFFYQYFNYILCATNSIRIELNKDLILLGILDCRKSERYKNAFFGYYDKSPWSFDMKYYLVHIFDERDQGKVFIGMYKCENSELEILDETPAFNFQQGTMLRWLNAKSHLIIYNTVIDNMLVSKIFDIKLKKEVKIIPMPIQTVNSEGTEALTLNYKRLDKIRPEYGYKVDVKNFSGDMLYEEDGIWRIDLNTGKYELIISLADLISNNHTKTMNKSQHKINHIMYSSSGKRFVFMHRWIGPYGKFSRLYTANTDGSELYLLADDRMVSHYSWLDENYILAYARREPIGDKYFLFRDKSDDFRIIGDKILDVYGDGHPSFSPNKKWIITDTYPDKARMRHLLLYNLEKNKLIELGEFFSPWRYDGYYRCDLHPRWSPDGTKISIDSTHEGFRNSYIIDVSELIEKDGK